MKPQEFEALWQVVEPILPKFKPSPNGGRPRKSDKDVLRGILFILETGIPWEKIPHEMGCGCGMTCWRRLRLWEKIGVWDQLHHILLTQTNRTRRFNWHRFAIDSSTVASPRGARTPGRTPSTGASAAPSDISS